MKTRGGIRIKGKWINFSEWNMDEAPFVKQLNVMTYTKALSYFLLLELCCEISASQEIEFKDRTIKLYLN